MDITFIIVLVCSIGFFLNLRPSEAYLTAYLTGPWKNLTDDQVNNEMYPWWTYATFMWIIPVFLLADFLCYKPILLLSAGAFIATWALLLWAQGIRAMQLVEVAYGFTTAGDVVYYSYLFSMVTDKHFGRVSSFTRASVLVGRFVAYLCGQILVSTKTLDLYDLNIFSFVSVCIGFVLTLALPSVQYSEIFHRKDDQEHDRVDIDVPISHIGNSIDTHNGKRVGDVMQTFQRKPIRVGTFREGFVWLINELKRIYSSDIVRIWTIWWVFATCGNLQVNNYIQNLWKEVSPDKEDQDLYNGAVEAAGTLFSAIAVLLITKVPIDWSVKGRAELLMSLVCGVNGIFLVIIGRTTSIWVAYILYDVFRASYQIVVTIATWQTAKYLPKQRYGFVFGVNMFGALLIETILTAIVVDTNGLAVDIRTQFIVYGGYFLVLTVPFTIMAVRNRFRGEANRDPVTDKEIDEITHM